MRKHHQLVYVYQETGVTGDPYEGGEQLHIVVQ